VEGYGGILGVDVVVRAVGEHLAGSTRGIEGVIVAPEVGEVITGAAEDLVTAPVHHGHLAEAGVVLERVPSSRPTAVTDRPDSVGGEHLRIAIESDLHISVRSG